MEEKLNKLKQLQGEVADLNRAGAVLNWDQRTYMPPGGAQDRGSAISTLRRIAHQKQTSEEMGRLLEDLAAEAHTLDPESDEAKLIEISKENFDKQAKVSSDWVAEFAKASALSNSAWVKARVTSDFALFQPHLEKMVELRRQYAEFFAPYDHVYDPLLDGFERGMKTVEVQEIFDALRPQQVALIEAIREKPQVDSSFLHQKFPLQDQWDFGIEVITEFGFDFERGRQDETAHPFTTSFGLGDVRLTTRFSEGFFNMGLFGTMHECGHGLHGQGGNPAYDRTELIRVRSQAISESQSRMYENLVGRSLPFWKRFYPRLQERFPIQLGKVDLMTFYKGINRVEPSLIRVEADEATYNLHIMLRLELEIALMEGSVAVKDLPEVWNDRMKKYLGVVPLNDALGVMQDVHWSGGMFGYFSTYALGNLVSVQLWKALEKDLPDIEGQIERGEFAPLLDWLREKIHRVGARYMPQDLIEKVTGSRIDPAPYAEYLRTKYGAIYGL